MSLIHEALKKAEQQRQLGAIPTLASPVQVVRQRRAWLAPIAALVAALILVVGAWWRLRDVPTAASDSAAASAPVLASADDTKAPASRVPPADGAAGPPAPGLKSTLPPNAAAPAPRTPPRATAPAPPPAAPAAPPVDSAVANGFVPRPARSNPPPAAAPANVPPRDRAAPPSAPATMPVAAPVAPAAPSTPIVAATPDDHLPLYWELPYADRKDLPEFKISMHVYAADPADRFVILNGTRQKEGDSLQGDLKLVRIDPSGVVLEHKGKQFRVPRGGGY